MSIFISGSYYFTGTGTSTGNLASPENRFFKTIKLYVKLYYGMQDVRCEIKLFVDSDL